MTIETCATVSTITGTVIWKDSIAEYLQSIISLYSPCIQWMTYCAGAKVNAIFLSAFPAPTVRKAKQVRKTPPPRPSLGSRLLRRVIEEALVIRRVESLVLLGAERRKADVTDERRSTHFRTRKAEGSWNYVEASSNTARREVGPHRKLCIASRTC